MAKQKVQNKKPLKNKPQQKPPVKKAEKSGNQQWLWIALAIVFIATIVIYFKATGYGYAWDDDPYIIHNTWIKALHWENIKQFFTGFFIGNYQPVTILTYAIEQHIAKDSWFLLHLTNIIVHLLNVYLVFVLIRKISPKNVAVALITAAFFAIHPMHVESVAWVSGTKDVLYTFFFLLSLIMYFSYRSSDDLKKLIYSGIFFILSCMSKSAAVILPLVMLALDYYSSRKLSLKMFLEKVPFFAISLVFGIIAMISQKAVIGTNAPDVSFIDRISIVSFSFISYLFKTIVPIDQSALYPFPDDTGSALPLIYYLSVLFVVFILVAVWFSRKWGKDVIFGFAFFVITIILVLQFVPVGSATMADRYTYIPYIGLFFIIGKLFEYLSAETKSNFKTHRNLMAVMMIAGFFAFSTVSFARVKVWQNDDTLFSDVINQYPDCGLAYFNRGAFNLNYMAQKLYANDNEKKLMYVKRSLKDFDETLDIDSNYVDAYINRGSARIMTKDFAGAIKDFSKTIELNKKEENAVAYINRGIARNELKDYKNAISDFDMAISIKADYADAYTNRGCSKFYLNDFKGALDDYNKVIELTPQDPNAIRNRDVVKRILGITK